MIPLIQFVDLMMNLGPFTISFEETEQLGELTCNVSVPNSNLHMRGVPVVEFLQALQATAFALAYKRSEQLLQVPEFGVAVIMRLADDAVVFSLEGGGWLSTIAFETYFSQLSRSLREFFRFAVTRSFEFPP